MEMRSLVLSLVLVSLSSVADDAVCVRPNPSNPNPEIEKSARDTDCAVTGGFQNSCAYKEFKLGEVKDSAPKDAKTLAESLGQVFDPAAAIDSKRSDLRSVQAALKDPEFFSYLWIWRSGQFGKKMPAKVPPDSNYSDSEKQTFEKAIAALYFPQQPKNGSYEGMNPRPPMSYLSGAIQLLSTLPADRRGSLDEKKKLVEKVALKGILYRAQHSAGCRYVSILTKDEGRGYEPYGPIWKKGESGADDVTAGNTAKERSGKETEKYRSISGAGDNLASCSTPHTTPRPMKGVSKIIRSCEVDLPVQLFADNTATLPKDKEDKITGSIEQNSCYQSATKDGLKIAKVAVATSANTLHNTGGKYCKYGFQALSDDRGSYLRGVLKDHFGQSLADNRFPPADSAGENQDGTSGPCAYEAKELPGKGADPNALEVTEDVGGNKVTRYFSEKRKSEFTGPKGEAKLEEFKFAKATIYFEDKVNPVQSDDSQYAAESTCTELRYSCE